ncbi:unnamed protein product [Angiostrongylus costaricensis]|uniref:O-phosphoseryl-tRNA(Sec) selenium transferase n=1 Tax=Angiostrongylus costaricensis TaxID=334426 RepID=A0A0R3PER7_ANGCS|nr:unnamed protein product [Angiostrongylus costaricensis]
MIGIGMIEEITTGVREVLKTARSITVGAGEREGRVSCSFVRKLHCNLSHGIGRSGNILDIQPKAIGSSMLACLANEFALHALQEIGKGSRAFCVIEVPTQTTGSLLRMEAFLDRKLAAVVVPMCTGLTLSLCMGSWRKLRPHAKYVLWLRVDQKSCLKSIFHAGFEPLIVEPIRAGDALVTDIETVNGILQDRADEILCVLSTTSCFAPRSPDSIEAISSICQLCHVPHLVNNAYGLQSEECVRLLSAVLVHNLIIIVLFIVFILFQKMKALLMSFASDIGESVYDVEDNLISLGIIFFCFQNRVVMKCYWATLNRSPHHVRNHV